jgi:hypothetical protein
MKFWDYLIVTASHAEQAAAYRTQLEARRAAGLLPRVRSTLVVADLDGRRIGSGGSTLECLRLVANRERAAGESVEQTLARLRILIVHAGGDSRRLPAYGPCGKIFVPVPGESAGPLPLTLFDRLTPPFLTLPAPEDGAGQVVVAAGDALLLFDSSGVRFPGGGLTMLGSPASPEEAARHGVFCAAGGGRVRLYLQKPARAVQEAAGAIRPDGRTVLDIGVANLDAATAAALLAAFGAERAASGELEWSAAARATLIERGVDLYREICCAMGEEATLAHYIESALAAGSKWSEEALARLYPALRRIPFRLETLPGCRFLHFGSTRQLVESGVALLAADRGETLREAERSAALLASDRGAALPDAERSVALPEADRGVALPAAERSVALPAAERSVALLAADRGETPGSTLLSLNNRVAGAGAILGRDAWVEGCRIEAGLTLAGRAVMVGADVTAPLSLPDGAALDLTPWREGWFVRGYGIDDSFKDTCYLGRPVEAWLAAVGASPADIWREGEERTLWTARLFPSTPDPEGYRRWLWMYGPAGASEAERRAWREAPRYSAAAIALAADQDAFHQRRVELRLPAAEARRC